MTVRKMIQDELDREAVENDAHSRAKVALRKMFEDKKINDKYGLQTADRIPDLISMMGKQVSPPSAFSPAPPFVCADPFSSSQPEEALEYLTNWAICVIIIGKSSKEVKEKMMGTKDFVRLLAGMLRKTYDMSHSTLTEKNLKILAKLPFIPSQIHLTEVKDLIKTVLNRLKKSTEVDENGKRTLAELSEKIKVSWKEAFNKAAEEAKKPKTSAEKPKPAADKPKVKATLASSKALSKVIEDQKASVASETKPSAEKAEAPPAPVKPKEEEKKAVSMKRRSFGTETPASPPAPPTVAKEEPEAPSKKRKRKMTVSWKPDDYLCTYYEIPGRGMNKEEEKKAKAQTEKEKHEMHERKRKEREKEERERNEAIRRQRMEEQAKREADQRAWAESFHTLALGGLESENFQPIQTQEYQEMQKRCESTPAGPMMSEDDEPKEPPAKPMSKVQKDAVSSVLNNAALMKNLMGLGVMGGGSQQHSVAPSSQHMRPPQQMSMPMQHQQMRPPHHQIPVSMGHQIPHQQWQQPQMRPQQMHMQPSQALTPGFGDLFGRGAPASQQMRSAPMQMQMHQPALPMHSQPRAPLQPSGYTVQMGYGQVRPPQMVHPQMGYPQMPPPVSQQMAQPGMSMPMQHGHMQQIQQQPPPQQQQQLPAQHQGKKICAYFNAPGGCTFGDECKFAHIRQ